MNNKEKLLEFVRQNWKKIPYICNMPENEIQKFLEEEFTYKSSQFMEYMEISTIRKNTGEYIDVIEVALDTGLYSDEYDPIALMSFDENGIFRGSLFGNIGISFSIDDNEM